MVGNLPMRPFSQLGDSEVLCLARRAPVIRFLAMGDTRLALSPGVNVVFPSSASAKAVLLDPLIGVSIAVCREGYGFLQALASFRDGKMRAFPGPVRIVSQVPQIGEVLDVSPETLPYLRDIFGVRVIKGFIQGTLLHPLMSGLESKVASDAFGVLTKVQPSVHWTSPACVISTAAEASVVRAAVGFAFGEKLILAEGLDRQQCHGLTLAVGADAQVFALACV
jgi:hypothetical protein